METNDFYVEQTRCVICNRPTPRIGIPVVDEMRGKDPVICGFCLVEIAKTATEQKRSDADE